MKDKSIKVLEFNKIQEFLKNYTCTKAAKDIIEDLKPYDSVYEVREHLEETKEAFKLLITKGAPPFEGVYDIRSGISLAEKRSTLLPGQLLKIAAVLRCARRFKEYINHKEEEESYRVLENICEGIFSLPKIEEEIFNAIEGEDEIADRASSTLYNIRRSLKEKNYSVRDKINSLVRSYSSYLQENIYTVRGDRYVLPVKAEHKGAVPGLVHDQSSTGATLFIEPMSLVNLNNEIKELMLKEKAEIERILTVLSAKINANITGVKTDANIVWELDFIFAKAKFASEYNCTCPTINDEGIVDIIEGRHPLIDRREVVPISVKLGEEFTSLMITGPNTGGKTVTLKTVGLIHLMAMSGLMIPARENSVISYFNNVFADIGDEQSIEQSLSTFSSHMKNIVEIMDKADENSLVLFDELGAGTDPTEGAALAISILENLRKRGTKIIATTHYSELKAYALKKEGVENASVEFDVETLRPTYRLLIGIPGKSNAFEISKRLGLPDYIIDFARENISNENIRFEELIENLQEKSIKAQEDARLAENLKLERDKEKKKYEEKLEGLQKVRDNALIDARREAKNIIKEAKEEADKILKDIRQLERMGYSSDARRKLEEERKKLKDKLDSIEEKEIKTVHKGEALKNVKEGDEVLLASINQKVIVLSKPDNKGDVLVQAGIMKITANIKDLRAAKGSNSNSSSSKIKKSKKLNLNLRRVESSVDLRGMDAEEAIYTVDKYLDEAYLGGLGEVTIVHGKGTGVLRKTIMDMLKGHSHVKKYRLGEYGEGGTGVTVVELK
ncbi:endonuclease MutS2 [Clostridium botulinum]|uniref:Endonuclease MutS2 n=1 Tax=Clostridium botulinum (strain Okra / Type B1) TaxID=498213 RepID=MUTS2_CLOBK|nr:endonuclease MutS2 [Clostridium botulinum]B1IMK5.1 RecName: Full=Endonuclease MutS2 [Clostridium botulinum B1 str. Okra]EKX79084.1 recombination and DNA strand exchange inhibitor protein [Clostridium botulinum CFSAN001628]ACA44194.1 MutS2 family protein [Clostridium botulinum B1 str. Okra]MBD5562878.1 endonuclease MutS2 [Clostridium botulinum]MBD5568135.1 endonuclease MutS2 [Clostridium botulinum]MBD5568573.1 endonuclease MutS2 [Clostridium botulinum]